MSSFDMPKQISALLLVEVCKGWTIDAVPVAAGNYQLGTVLACVSGKYQPVDFAGTGAVKKSVAVLAEAVEGGAEGIAPVIARGAVVAVDELVWPEGATEAQKSTALSELAALGVVARQPL